MRQPALGSTNDVVVAGSMRMLVWPLRARHFSAGLNKAKSFQD